MAKILTPEDSSRDWCFEYLDRACFNFDNALVSIVAIDDPTDLKRLSEIIDDFHLTVGLVASAVGERRRSGFSSAKDD